MEIFIADGLCSDLMQILCSLSDNPSSSQPKRRREPNTIIDPHPQPQSQHNYRGALWEQPSFAGGPLQRQIAASKLELPPHMQMLEYAGPGSHWDINGVTAKMGSHEQQSSITGPVVDTTRNIPPPVPFAAGVAVHPISFGQDDHTPYLLDPHLQPYAPQAAQDPASSIGLDVPDDLFAMWENAPISFRCVDFLPLLRCAR